MSSKSKNKAAPAEKPTPKKVVESANAAILKERREAFLKARPIYNSK